MDGIIIIDKPSGITSREVVNKISQKLKTKKVGHTGTLDPLATGVLVLTINKATKIGELLTSYDKEYIAEIVLGIKTDTLDITGKTIEKKEAIFTKEQIIKVLNEMPSSYEQEVPIYSAVKINGKKLYEYARNNEEVKLPTRVVNIKKLELISDIKYQDNQTIFKIKCLVSKGTYIRSLVNDIALKLNTVGTMKSLRRTKQGEFKIEDALKIEDVTIKNIIPIKHCLNYNQVEVSEELFNKIKNGQILNSDYDTPITFTYQNEVIAIYKDYKDNKIKPWKMFI